MKTIALAFAVLFTLAATARADEGAYGSLDPSRLTKPQEDFFWRRLKSLAVEAAVLGYCGEADDFAVRATQGVQACVTKAALEKARAFFDAERKTAEQTLRTRKASCHGKTGPQRGWLGVEIAAAPNGALVTGNVEGSPAASADVKAGDVIVSLDGEATPGPKEISAKIRARPPGAVVALGLMRDGAGRTASVKLGGMAFDASGQAALDTGGLISASRADLAEVATQVTGMCGQCKTSIWAMFCR